METLNWGEELFIIVLVAILIISLYYNILPYIKRTIAKYQLKIRKYIENIVYEYLKTLQNDN